VAAARCVRAPPSLHGAACCALALWLSVCLAALGSVCLSAGAPHPSLEALHLSTTTATTATNQPTSQPASPPTNRPCANPTTPQGHKHMESFGVLHSPSVMCVDLAPEDCCVVLASDGARAARAARAAPLALGMSSCRGFFFFFVDSSMHRQAHPPHSPCTAVGRNTNAPQPTPKPTIPTHSRTHNRTPTTATPQSPTTTTAPTTPQSPKPTTASAGVWDVMDPTEVVNRVMDALSDGQGAALAARRLVEDAVALAEGAPGGDADNTSAVVIALPLGG